MTILDASGWSKMREFHLQWRGQDIAYDLVPKVKLEVVIPDSQLDSVVQAITESARTEEGEHGNGVIFIFTIDEVVNIGSSDNSQERSNGCKYLSPEVVQSQSSVEQSEVL